MKSANVCAFEGGGRKTNGDIEKLRRVLYAMQDVRCARELAAWERGNLYGISAKPIGGMPGHSSVPRGLDEGLEKLEEKVRGHERATEEFQRELDEAEDILGGIRNRNVRTLVVMVYVLGLGHEEVKRRLNMTDYQYRKIRAEIENAESMKDVEIAL